MATITNDELHAREALLNDRECKRELELTAWEDNLNDRETKLNEREAALATRTEFVLSILHSCLENLRNADRARPITLEELEPGL